jgi:hypothetical protein
MISFCSEKTVEFSLVPEFSKLIKNLGENAPIQYWKTREGNLTSKYLHGNENVYLVAFFSRRPKVDTKKNHILQGKINNYIFEFNVAAKNMPITVFCGFPLAKNLYELSDSKKIWINIPKNASVDQEVLFLAEENEGEHSIYCKQPLKIIEQEDVCDIIKKDSHPITWVEAIDVMEKLKRKPGRGHWFLLNWYYKPVYFVIKANIYGKS